MAQRYIRDLFEHQEWADALVWGAALSSEAASADSVIREKLHHIHTVQRAFLQIWREEPIAIPPPHDFPGTAAIAAWGRETQREIAAFLRTVDEERLSHAVSIPWAGRITEMIGKPPAAAYLRDTLVQVPMHSAHHRGQVCTRLSAVGATAPLVDYVAWIWMGRPQAAWPEAVLAESEAGAPR